VDLKVIRVIKAKLARGAQRTGSVCPLCREALSAEARGHCPSCRTPYHRACFAEFGGCATLGCASYRQPMKGAIPHRPLACAACWEETTDLRTCPECETPIHAHCLAEEGCGTRGCARERPPRPQARRSSGDAPSSPQRTFLAAVLLGVVIVCTLAAIQIFGILGLLAPLVVLAALALVALYRHMPV